MGDMPRHAFESALGNGKSHLPNTLGLSPEKGGVLIEVGLPSVLSIIPPYEFS